MEMVADVGKDMLFKKFRKKWKYRDGSIVGWELQVPRFRNGLHHSNFPRVRKGTSREAFVIQRS